MDRKDFKTAMLRGQGRSVLACQQDPERYRKEVLWGCSHLLAYDPQCEGSRAWYICQLVRCYPDAAPFREASLTALFRPSTKSWLQLQVEEFLYILASDGDQVAKEALWAKYEQMLSAICSRRRRPRQPVDDLRDDFVSLAITLSLQEKDALRIAIDIGRLAEGSPAYDVEDFDPFFWYIRLNKHITALRKLARTDPYAARFLRESEKAEKESTARPAERSKLQRTPSSYQIARYADEDDFRIHAWQYMSETDPQRRADLLHAFTLYRPFPFDPEPILQDALSAIAPLRAEAWDALHLVRHPKVRAFAQAHPDAAPVELIPVLITNYISGDRPLLEAKLAQLPRGRAGDDILHAIGMSVLDLRDIHLNAPAWLLQYFYDTDPCSVCREWLVREMGRRRLLTDDILRESVYDANDEIRRYVLKAKRALVDHHD